MANVNRGGAPASVLYIDLDHFKDVNDTLGHPIGDELIRSVTLRLSRTLRGDDLVARLGGDEFAVITTSTSEAAALQEIANRIIARLCAPYSINGHTIVIGASIGIAVIDRRSGGNAADIMLAALMGGQSLTGSELAFLAHVSRPTASEHLRKLVNARLVSFTKRRRHHYYCIASPLVAKMLESIKAVAAIETPARYEPRSARDDALRLARTCYDHLAGKLGVAIADALVARKYLLLSDDGGEVTRAGGKFLGAFGADLNPKRSQRMSESPARSRPVFVASLGYDKLKK